SFIYCAADVAKWSVRGKLDLRQLRVLEDAHERRLLKSALPDVEHISARRARLQTNIDRRKNTSIDRQQVRREDQFSCSAAKAQALRDLWRVTMAKNIVRLEALADFDEVCLSGRRFARARHAGF